MPGKKVQQEAYTMQCVEECVEEGMRLKQILH